MNGKSKMSDDMTNAWKALADTWKQIAQAEEDRAYEKRHERLAPMQLADPAISKLPDKDKPKDGDVK